MTATARDLVATHPFAAGLTDAQLDALCAGAEVVEVAAGTRLVQEGRPADHGYLVVDGRLGIELHLPARGDVTVGTVGPGELLGWSWLTAPRRWRFDAVARTDARLVALDADAVAAAGEADPTLALAVTRQVVRTMTDRLEATRHQLLDVHRHGPR